MILPYTDELVAESVVATGRAEVPALEDQTVVAAHDRRLPRRAQGAKPCQAGVLEGALRFLGPRAQGELVADELWGSATSIAADSGRCAAIAIMPIAWREERYSFQEETDE